MEEEEREEGGRREGGEKRKEGRGKDREEGGGRRKDRGRGRREGTLKEDGDSSTYCHQHLIVLVCDLALPLYDGFQFGKLFPHLKDFLHLTSVLSDNNLCVRVGGHELTRLCRICGVNAAGKASSENGPEVGHEPFYRVKADDTDRVIRLEAELKGDGRDEYRRGKNERRLGR